MALDRSTGPSRWSDPATLVPVLKLVPDSMLWTIFETSNRFSLHLLIFEVFGDHRVRNLCGSLRFLASLR